MFCTSSIIPMRMNKMYKITCNIQYTTNQSPTRQTTPRSTIYYFSCMHTLYFCAKRLMRTHQSIKTIASNDRIMWSGRACLYVKCLMDFKLKLLFDSGRKYCAQVQTTQNQSVQVRYFMRIFCRDLDSIGHFALINQLVHSRLHARASPNVGSWLRAPRTHHQAKTAFVPSSDKWPQYMHHSQTQDQP